MSEEIETEKEDSITLETPNMEDVLNSTHQIFIYKEIDAQLALEVNKKVISFSISNPELPITIWINSPGGCVMSGLSIIDNLMSRPNPIVTIVTGEAASMAGLISICGDYRLMTENAYWMEHASTAGAWGDQKTIDDRIKFYKQLDKRVLSILKKRTHLTEDEILDFERGELWLNAKQAKKKGVIDKVMKIRMKDINRLKKVTKKKKK